MPADKVLIPGVIDTCTNSIEHPETVAQRIERYAGVIGRERVIAGTDCGFATMAGRSAVVPDVAYAKLASLAEGARPSQLPGSGNGAAPGRSAGGGYLPRRAISGLFDVVDVVDA